MPSECCYFVDKAAAAGAAPALNYFGSILHCSAVFTQNLGQTRCSHCTTCINTAWEYFLLWGSHLFTTQTDTKANLRITLDTTVLVGVDPSVVDLISLPLMQGRPNEQTASSPRRYKAPFLPDATALQRRVHHLTRWLRQLHPEQLPTHECHLPPHL